MSAATDIDKAFYDWCWHKPGSRLGFMSPADAAKEAFLAGAEYERKLNCSSTGPDIDRQPMRKEPAKPHTRRFAGK